MNALCSYFRHFSPFHFNHKLIHGLRKHFFSDLTFSFIFLQLSIHRSWSQRYTSDSWDWYLVPISCTWLKKTAELIHNSIAMRMHYGGECELKVLNFEFAGNEFQIGIFLCENHSVAECISLKSVVTRFSTQKFSEIHGVFLVEIFHSFLSTFTLLSLNVWLKIFFSEKWKKIEIHQNDCVQKAQKLFNIHEDACAHLQLR